MAENTMQDRLARIEELANSGLKHAAAQLARLILEDDVNNFEALIWLARTSNQPEEANKALDRAAQLRPNDPAVRDLLYGNGQPVTSNPVSSNPFSAAPPQPQPSYTPPQPIIRETNSYTPAQATSSSSFDYLNSLNSTTAAPPPPLTAEPIKPVNREGIKVKRGPNPIALVLGLLFLIGGLIGAIWWALLVANFNGGPTNQIQGQVINLSSNDSRSILSVQPKGTTEKLDFPVSQNFVATLIPLIADSKNKGSIAPNSIIVNVNNSGRLTSLDVITPNKGTASNNLSLVGMGMSPEFDWIFVGVQLVVALIGLMIIGLSFNRKTA